MGNRIIQILVFGGNIFLLLMIDIYLWVQSWCCGLGGLVGIAGFFFGYSISEGMAISRRDKWKLPEYGVFKRKLLYGNSIAGTVTVVASVILYVVQMMITGA